MKPPIDHLLQFDIEGHAAHFKKYYSNISALTYEIPTRTNIMGILASILKLSRDSYYELFSVEHSKISVRPLIPLRKYFAYTNYHDPTEGGNIQTRVELLFPKEPYKKLQYRLFLWHQDRETSRELYQKIKEGNDGYGVYLGQRQLRATLHNPVWWEQDQFSFQKNWECVMHSVTSRENVDSMENTSGTDITSVLMPMDMQALKDGREPLGTDEILCELTGQGIKGKFREGLQLPEENIAFFTLVNYDKQ